MLRKFTIWKSKVNPGKWCVLGFFAFYYEDSFKDAIIRMDLLAGKAELSA